LDNLREIDGTAALRILNALNAMHVGKEKPAERRGKL
jgi:hypothetical protein